jgi:hypothetical protein
MMRLLSLTEWFEWLRMLDLRCWMYRWPDLFGSLPAPMVHSCFLADLAHWYLPDPAEQHHFEKL